MLFNSIQFAIFFPIVFLLYWLLARQKLAYQNLLLLAASYFFYACWDWRFLFLLIFSTLLDFFTGIMMSHEKNVKKRRFWFWSSILINLGFLGIFKYYNFFIQSFVDLLSLFNIQSHFNSLNVILPVGISFYTFHGLSYVIDIYKGRIKAEKNFIDYSLFVSFFPLLVAGPIERATHLLPQIKQKRTFQYEKAVDGLKQILWGLIKKVVIADQCATYADIVFNDYTHYGGSTLVVGAILFSIQIYSDFSGYSDMALGTAKLLGIDLLRNFNYPYFSRDIAEFWRRWHISLSGWFRDYLYIPLGGSQGGMWIKIRNTFIIFIVSGFWHGANWTFIVWGALNAIYFLPLLITNNNRLNTDCVAQEHLLPNMKEVFQMATTFMLVTIGWIFFRSKNIIEAIEYIHHMLAGLFYGWGYLQTWKFVTWEIGYDKILVLFLFFIIEWLGRREEFAIAQLVKNKGKIYRYVFYYTLIGLIIWYSGEKQQFIYFQF